MTRYRVQIDRSLCSGFGACSDLAPDVFELGPDAIASVRVGETSDSAVLEAVEACPMGAIEVVVLQEEQAA
jgi:ferredoxin